MVLERLVLIHLSEDCRRITLMIAAIVEHSAGGANTFPKKGLPARAGGPIYWAYVIGMS